MISIKATNQTEIRRFAIPVQSSFVTLESSVRSMFKITGLMTLKYTDDEGDLCTITTDPELQFAVTLNPNLLRLSIFIDTTPASISLPLVPQQAHQRWAAHLEQKTVRLTAKQTRLSTKLAETTDPERKQVLACKLEGVQQKLAFFESRKTCMFQQPHNNQERKPWRAHGGQQRGCRGRPEKTQHDEKHQIPEHPHHPYQHPHHFPASQDPQERQQKWIGFLEKRTQALNEKRECILLKLADDKLAPERRNFLDEKLRRIQEKLVFIENKKQRINQCGQDAPNSHPCKGRGGRRNGRFSECKKNPETQ